MIVAVTPVAAACALPAIILISAAGDIGGTGKRKCDPHAVAPVAPAPVVINMPPVDIAVDIHVPVDIAIDIHGATDVVAADSASMEMTAACMEASTASGLSRSRRSCHSQQQ